MPYENKKGIAEIYESDYDEDEINLWLPKSSDDLKTESLSKDISDLRNYIRPGEIGGLKDILENKNEFDPGHSHLFLPKDKTVIFSHFESLDGWTTGGVGTEVITIKLGGTSLATGASSGDDAWAIASGATTDTFDVSQDSLFQSVLKLSGAATITSYWGAGDITAGGAFGAANEEGYGFKYVNGTLSALSVKNGAETLTTILGITATNFNEYRAIWNTRSVKFYVNGVWKVTHTAGLMDTDDDVFATFYVKTTTTAARTIYVKYLYFVQQNV